MDTKALNRRSLLRAAATTTIGAALIHETASAAERAAPSATASIGPWTYVAPGESVQSAISGGAKAILLGSGEYQITTPIIPTAGCAICGVGQSTRLRATAAIDEIFAIGNGGAVDGVIISDMVIDCDGKAAEGIDLNVVGTTGFYQGEPDSVCRLDNLWVYDPVQDGVVYRGSDTQACVTSRVRVRRAGRYGFRIESPDSWWIGCEATTSTQTGSSAGFYIGSAISGSNGIGAGNNFFQACKAWYCRDYGFHVKGTRNKFIGCESQDTRSHGWYIEWDKNTFTGCSADTAGCADVGGTAGSADGFYIAAGDATSMVGCQAFDRKPGGSAIQQRYGFNAPASMVSGGRLIGYSGWDNGSGLLNQR